MDGRSRLTWGARMLEAWSTGMVLVVGDRDSLPGLTGAVCQQLDGPVRWAQADPKRGESTADAVNALVLDAPYAVAAHIVDREGLDALVAAARSTRVIAAVWASSPEGAMELLRELAEDPGELEAVLRGTWVSNSEHEAP